MRTALASALAKLKLISSEALHPHQHPDSWAQALLLLTRGVKKKANEIRVGNVVNADGRLLLVCKYHYTQGMSRQLGNVHMEMKDIQTNSKVSERFRPADMVELAVLEDKNLTILYMEGNSVCLMDATTFDQIQVDTSLFGEQSVFLKEEMSVEVSFHGAIPVAGIVPKHIEMKVVETDATGQGDTVNARFKPAILENGIKVSVPTFIAAKETIILNTTDRTFVKRK